MGPRPLVRLLVKLLDALAKRFEFAASCPSPADASPTRLRLWFRARRPWHVSHVVCWHNRRRCNGAQETRDSKMLALTDASLARLLIAATAIAPAEREGMARS
jgi:hypothetical protein